jgi:hypothetical protein
MNQHNAIVRYSGSIPIVGTTPQSGTPSSPAPFPVRGEVALIEAELSSGASTTLRTELIEGASGHVLYDSGVVAIPGSGIVRLQAAGPIPFVGVGANMLVVRLTSDDGSNTSTFATRLDVRGS